MIYFNNKYYLKKQKLYLSQTIYILGRLFSAFYLHMGSDSNKIKNLKISEEAHDILKKYCDKRGVKIYRFLENLIREKCSESKDIYGEN